MTFDEWVAELDDNNVPRYQKLYNHWYNEDNTSLMGWQAYYYALRRAFEAGAKSV